MTNRLLKYWDLLRKSSPFPDIRHLNPSAIEDVWPNCLLVGVDARKNVTYKYEYMGEAITTMYGRDFTNEYVDHRVKQFPGTIMGKKLEELMSGRKPEEDGGSFINEEGKVVKYRACFLPFGKNNKRVTHIVVGLSCRVF